MRLGLNSLTSGYDWRGPVADRIYLPTAHCTDNVTDAVREANCLVAIAETLLGDSKPDSLPRFSFNYPGAVQGFKVVAQDNYDNRARLENLSGESLSLVFRNLVKDWPLALQTATHTCESDDVRRYPYHLLGSPTLYSGQRVKAVLSCETNVPSIGVVPYIVTFDQDLNRAEYDLAPCMLLSGEETEHEFIVTQVNSEQIAYLGFRLDYPAEGDGAHGCLNIHQIDWASTPSLDLSFPASRVGQWVTPWWANSFISTMTQEMFIGGVYLMNDTPGEKRMFVYGSNDFRDYTAQIDVTPQSMEPWSVVFHYQGLKRYVEARFDPVSESLSLVLNHFDTQTVLASESFKFEQRKAYETKLIVSQDVWQIEVEDTVLECNPEQVIDYGFEQGCIGVANEFGSMQLSRIKLQPIVQD